MHLKRKIINPFIRLPNRILRRAGYRLVESKSIPLSFYKKTYGQRAIKEHRFINIGAGAFFNHPAWANLNKTSDWYSQGSVHIEHDLISGKPLPKEDATIYAVYTSNTIEHVDQKNAELLFSEVYRILKKGGVFRIITPDTDLFYQAYKNNDRLFYEMNNASFPGISIPQLFLHSIAVQLSATYPGNRKNKITDPQLASLFKKHSYVLALDNITSRCNLDIQRKHPEHHLNWYNEKKLKYMLKKAGFSDISRSGYGQSRSPILRDTNFFDCSNPKTGVFIEAFK